MAQRGPREDGQKGSPDTDEEPEDEKNNHPRFGMDGAPKVSPVASVRCGQEEILDDNGNEKPEHDLATHD